jgi:hypothetical protein
MQDAKYEGRMSAVTFKITGIFPTVFNGSLYHITTGTPTEQFPFIFQVAVYKDGFDSALCKVLDKKHAWMY